MRSGQGRNLNLSFTHFLSSEEEKNVSLYLLAEVDLNHGADGGFQVVPLWLRSEEDLHWMCAPRNTLHKEMVKSLARGEKPPSLS